MASKPAKYEPPPIEKNIPELDGWLTRDETADILGIGHQTVVSWEMSGRLHPKRVYRSAKDGTQRATYLYDPREIARMPSARRPHGKTAGEVASRAFSMFADGKSQAEVVIMICEPPEKVRQLHDEWRDMGGMDFVITPIAKSLLEGCLGKIESLSDLVERVKTLAKSEIDTSALTSATQEG